jgi:hypothetical protein
MLLEGKVKCLVSIGAGVPSLKAFKDDVLHIGETLVAIATQTEQTAERFRRERALLDSTRRYYRFNVVRGLEDIGLEEGKKVKEMAAATRSYTSGRRRVQAASQEESYSLDVLIVVQNMQLKSVQTSENIGSSLVSKACRE